MKRHFLTGLAVIVPVWGTCLILTTLFTALDGALGDLLGPGVSSSIPGLGVLALFLVLLTTGALASNLLGARLWKSSEAALLRIPLVRSIYTTFKSVTDIFSFMDRQRENRIVLLPFPRLGLYAIGLQMGDAPDSLQLAPDGRLSLIFVPTAPHPFTGYLALVLTHELIPLSMGFHEAMKMEFSAGLYVPQTVQASQQT
ncbi:MAG: hypothetical protein A3K11_01240 [Nitrospirae bacterium RIFCSPLOWO2_12_FULL_63_8]|nr:MAG: hypothetical protein A3K11_01240 [Nitrospirae bacterium RIFCSPLOWO2_12_FULL_63_8]